MKNIVVLISGGGTNLQAIIDACATGEINAKISAVVSNKADAFGLTRAAKANINTAIISHKDYDDRESFDIALRELVESYNPDLVICAGFMRILTGAFVNHFLGRSLNIHPSLLPKFTGLNTHQRAIDAGESEAGTSVHFVTEELDGGPVVIQAAVPVLSDDNAQVLAARVLEQEHKIFPLAAKWFCEDRLTLTNGKAVLDGEILPDTGFQFKG
jgi:phosphoribosylglycinamide formyltransferase-1